MILENILKFHKYKRLSNFFKNKIDYIILIFWFVAVSVGLLETITYRGFLLRHFFVDSTIIYIIFAVFLIFGLPKLRESNFKVYSIFRKVNLILSVLLILIYVLSIILDNLIYDNFVFSVFHLNVQALIYPTLLTVYADTVLYGFKYLITTIVLLFLGLIISDNFSSLWADNFNKFKHIKGYPSASYEEKMENALGKQFYDYTMFVKNNTPEDAKILIPPFPAYPWPQTGNIPYMRYFLYPRELYNGKEYSPDHDLQKEGIDYVLITWGETVATSDDYTHGWPKFDVDADTIICTTDNTHAIEYHTDYSFEKYKEDCQWGVIKTR